MDLSKFIQTLRFCKFDEIILLKVIIRGFVPRPPNQEKANPPQGCLDYICL